MRIRTVKPEFWQSESMARCSPESRLLAIALLNFADDEGYFWANARVLHGALFPFDDAWDVAEMLQELAACGFLRIGEQSGNIPGSLQESSRNIPGTVGERSRKKIGFIVNFSKHQRVEKPQKSKISPLPIVWDGDSGNIPGTFQEQSGNIPGIVGEQSGNVPGVFPAGMEVEVEVEGEREKEITPLPPFEDQDANGGKRTKMKAVAADAYDAQLREIIRPDLQTSQVFEAWHSFVEYRNQHRMSHGKAPISPLSEIAAKAALKKLAAAKKPTNLIAAINDTINGDWDGIGIYGATAEGFFKS